MARPLLHALVGASRFGLLLGLSLWLGLGVALCLQLPLFGRRAPDGPGAELAAALVRRVEALLLLAVVLVVAGLASRVIIDRAAPPTTLVVPLAGMVLSRLLAAFAVAPSLRALRGRLGSRGPEASAAGASPDPAPAPAGAAPPATPLLPLATPLLPPASPPADDSPALAATATPAERQAFGRLESARRLLLTLEVCLALYALYALA